MKKAICHLKSISPYGQNKKVRTAKLSKEGHPEYEERTWRERAHTNENGEIVIPPMQFKKCVENVCSYIGMKIPGRSNATYTKHFLSGILVTDPLRLPNKIEDNEGHWQDVPSDGKKGGGKRVDKCFPVVEEWEGKVEFHILDDAITETVFATHLKEAGKYVGIGAWRPQNGGLWGRFKVEDIEWVESDE